MLSKVMVTDLTFPVADREYLCKGRVLVLASIRVLQGVHLGYIRITTKHAPLTPTCITH